MLLKYSSIIFAASVHKSKLRGIRDTTIVVFKDFTLLFPSLHVAMWSLFLLHSNPEEMLVIGVITVLLTMATQSHSI